MRRSLGFVSRMAIYNSFIILNFNHCSVIRMLTNKCSLNKFESLVFSIIGKCGSQGAKLVILRYMSLEVYNCVNNMNPQFLNEMFTLNKYMYDLRDNSVLERPAARLTNHGLKFFTSYGVRVWNII